MLGILYTVAVILLVLWIIGLLVHVASAAIHLLLVAAVIIVLWNLISGRRSTVLHGWPSHYRAAPRRSAASCD